MIVSCRRRRGRRAWSALSALLIVGFCARGASAQAHASGSGPATSGPAPASSAGGGAATLHPGAPRGVPTCERCHGELEFLRQHSGTLERARSINVSDQSLHGTGHDLPCGDCHRGFTSFPHSKQSVQTAACASCHPKVAAAWNAGAHAHVDQGSPVACKDCHGVHTVPTKAGLKDKATVRLMNGRCLGCHDTRKFLAHAPHSDSVACASCHGPHDVRAHDHPGSTLTAQAQLTTCGACHAREAKAWSTDVHGRAVLSGIVKSLPGEEPRRPPACTTCHGGHQMVHPKEVAQAAGPGAGCTTCHEKFADTFADSYHGQATKLGSTRAAGCAGCHTAHSVLPADSPRSTVAKANLVGTCRQCHPAATASFTGFQAHADVHDRAKSPLLYWTYRFMTLLLTGTLLFFGLHTALWLTRSLRGDRYPGSHSAGKKGGHS